MKEKLLYVILTCLLLAGCSRPGTSPAAEGDKRDHQQERIQRVGNGLIPLAGEDAIEWRNPRPLAERMAHYGVPKAFAFTFLLGKMVLNPALEVKLLSTLEFQGWSSLAAGRHHPPPILRNGYIHTRNVSR